MLERPEGTEGLVRSASLLEGLRERTQQLHTEAERSGIVADMLRGRARREDYGRLLRNLLPVYRTLEEELAKHASSPLLGPIVRGELERADAIEADLRHLGVPPSEQPVLPESAAYANAIRQAAAGDGSRLIAHAYVRYLGDLSGGQILKRLLARALDLSPAALSFFEFPGIGDLAAFKEHYRTAIDRAGDEIEDLNPIVEEGARAFRLNIDLSIALQRAAQDRAP
jgi:heme oxygenase